VFGGEGGWGWGFEEKREESHTLVAPAGFAYRLARELALPMLSADGPALFVGDADSASKALHHITSHRHMRKMNILFVRFFFEQLSSPSAQVRTVQTGSLCKVLFWQAVPTLSGVHVL